MTLGIVVDDTVHFLSKYLRARREKNLSAPEAVNYAFHTVGMALLTTSVVLVIGFLVLSLSAFKLNSGMGTLTAIVIALALIADFFFLPPLLMKLEENKNVQMDSGRRTADSAAAG
jgi:predicted RND superfamily exporter protein